MRCWKIDDAEGVWLRAYGVVFAATEEEARRLFDMVLEENALRQRHPYSLQEIPMRGAHLIWNGDY